VKHLGKFFLPFLFFPFLISAQIQFDDNFESGNIKDVKQIDSTHFEVTTRKDNGGRWFYFRISGVKNKKVGVTVTTSDVTRPMYSYDNETFVRFTREEAPYVNYFEKKFEKDTVYVAYYTPYTFTYLQKRIAEWRQNPYVISVDTIGYGEKGLPLQDIVLTDPFAPSSEKLQVWIHARTHPGETPGSFQFDGILQTLLSDDPVIEYYRQKIIFHLIPFVNPEGVYYGFSRTNPEYVDLERQWATDDSTVAPEVLALRNHMKEVNKFKLISVFQNIHSQASDRCTFWIHTASSTSNRYYRIEHQFANLATSDIPYFVQDDYSYSNLKDYFPEGFIWNNYGDKVLALTYETPYDYYSDGEEVTNENLYEIGRRDVYAIGEFLKLSHPKRIILDNEAAVVTGEWQRDTSGIEFFGDYFLTSAAGNGENKIVYSTGNIQKGKYDIYAWYPTREDFAYNTRFKIQTDWESLTIEKTEKTAGAQWNFLSEVNLQNGGEIKITIDNAAAGIVAADAFRIIYRGEPNSVKEHLIAYDFRLEQNYPNPFGTEQSDTHLTHIPFTLAKPGNVNLTVFNALGQKIAVLKNGFLRKGRYEVTFNPQDFGRLASGVYYYRLTFNGKSITKPMVFLK
jgi:hypothetical protein